MNARTSTYSTTRSESDRVRAARGFESFKAWARQNRIWNAEHRRTGKSELADALDREYDRFIRSNL